MPAARPGVAVERANQLAGLVVITAVGYAYTRADGVRAAPLITLGP